MTTRWIQPGEIGVDFSYTKPPPALLVAKGYTFVVGYLSPNPAKNLLNPQAYLDAGLAVIFVWEVTATQTNKGYTQGRIDGFEARRQANVFNMPYLPIIAANDTNTTAANVSLQKSYMRGFAETCGRMGEYDDTDLAGVTIDLWEIGWLPSAWSWSSTSKAAARAKALAIGFHVFQGFSFYLDGLYPIDPNEAVRPFEAWSTRVDTPPIETPIPTPESTVTDMPALVTNSEARQMPWGLQPAGAEFFVVGEWKRSASRAEMDTLYTGVVAKPLSNVVLDSIPTAAAQAPVVIPPIVLPPVPAAVVTIPTLKLAGTLGAAGIITATITV